MIRVALPLTSLPLSHYIAHCSNALRAVNEVTEANYGKRILLSGSKFITNFMLTLLAMGILFSIKSKKCLSEIGNRYETDFDWAYTLRTQLSLMTLFLEAPSTRPSKLHRVTGRYHPSIFLAVQTKVQSEAVSDMNFLSLETSRA